MRRMFENHYSARPPDPAKPLFSRIISQDFGQHSMIWPVDLPLNDLGLFVKNPLTGPIPAMIRGENRLIQAGVFPARQTQNANLESYTMTNLIKNFAKSESGAVTVDWVVLTAAMVGLGLAVMAVVSTGIESLSNDIATGLTNTQIGSPTFNGNFASGTPTPDTTPTPDAD
jgi:Flp pilus assembly pilin Flp